MRPGTRRAAVRLLAACCLLQVAACIPQGLAFRVDDRLTFTAPKDRADVTLPLTVSWSVRDFSVVEPGGSVNGDKSGYFAVFIDQAPQPPGKPLAWLARKDKTCRPADGCPDAQYLASRHVFTTTDTQITFEQLPRPARDDHRKERHSFTVVLLDPAGHRIGESAFQLDVVLHRTATS